MSKKNLTIQQLVKKISKQCQQNKNNNNDESNGEILVEQIQNTLQANQESISEFLHCLLIEMKKDNQMIKLTMIKLADYFFQKSSKFRKELCQNHLTDFVTGMGSSPLDNLPSSEVRNRLLRVIAEWNFEFGQTYPQLRAFARYLKESLQLPLPDIWRERRLAEEKAKQEYRRKRELRIIRLKQVFAEMKKHEQDIKNELNSLEECLNLLFPSISSRSNIFSKSSLSSTQEDHPPVRTDIEDDHEADSIKLRDPSTPLSPSSPSPPPPSPPPPSTDHQLSNPIHPTNLQRDFHHLLSNQLKRNWNSTTSIDSNSILPIQPSLDDDDSEWEDGSVIGENENIHETDPQTKKMKINNSPSTTVLETIQHANLGTLNYTLEITLPDWNDYQNENKELLFEKIKELSSHLQNYLLPLLYYWKKILSISTKLEFSLRQEEEEGRDKEETSRHHFLPNSTTTPTPQTHTKIQNYSKYFFLSKYLNIDELIIHDSINEVNQLIQNIEEILRERCSLLLTEREGGGGEREFVS